MGEGLAPGTDAASNGALSTGSFGSTGQSPPIVLYASFNISLWGTFVATVQLERSFDGGVTWLPVAASTAGNTLNWAAPFSGSWSEIEHNVAYRLNCTAYTSGTINYRLSNTSDFVWIGGVQR